MDVSLPAFAHRVTVLGSTRNIVATSAGVSNGSASGVRADMWPLLLDQHCDPASSFLAPSGACRGCPKMTPLRPYCHHRGLQVDHQEQDSATCVPIGPPTCITLRDCQLACLSASSARQRPVNRWYIAVANSISPAATALMVADTSATDWSAHSAPSSSRCTSPP